MGEKKFGKTIFRLKINFGSKKFLGQKDLGLKIFCLKKTSRVTPRGRMYAPPQKIVGLKFCWVILSRPKRIFGKKKNIGRVNPGRRRVDDPPPPENNRAKIVLGCC